MVKSKEIDVLKWNKILIFIDPILFINGMTFLSLTTTIPYFLLKLSATTTQISIVNLLMSFGFFLPSLFFANYAQNLIFKAKIFSKLLLIQRITFLIYIFLIPFFFKMGNQFTVYLFIIFWGIFCFFTGSYGPFYFSILDSAIPYRERGNLLGNAYAFAGILGLFSSWIINFYITKFNFPNNFILIFLTGILILIIDAILFYFIKENPENKEETSQVLSPKELFIKACNLLKINKNFQNTILGFIFLVISTSSLPYYIVYMTRTFKTSSNIVSQMAIITSGINILSSFIFGKISKSYGNKKVILLGLILSLTGNIFNIIYGKLIGALSAYALLTSLNNANMLVGGLLISSLVERENLPLYISINLTITMIFSSLMYLLNAKIIDFYGFKLVFLISIFAGALSLLQMEFKIKEKM
ncbi:MAG: MFS transporter [Dictyoglomaceae bacterium]|nr:MFS transporter [Dictyoglomaceae bacterium]